MNSLFSLNFKYFFLLPELRIFTTRMNDLSGILKSYIKGDNLAVAELYTNLKGRLLLLAYNYCRNKELSQDIVHDIFEKMIQLPVEKRNDYFGRLDTNIEAYLSVAIKNKCLDTKKINNNREKILYSVRYLFNPTIKNSSLEKFCQDGLKAMLDKLQPREQEIIKFHLDGYSNDEIAARLNLTYNTVKNNIYESKKKLKNLWELFMH